LKTFLRLLPAGLSALLLAAHFFRARLSAGVVAALVLFALAFVPRAWAVRTLQAGLALGALEWLRTAWAFAAIRRAHGQPTLRLWLILSGVAAFTAFAAWWLGPRAAGRPHSNRSTAASRPQ
jgi:hypothetical protein